MRQNTACWAANRTASFIGDYEFTHGPQDVELLEAISHVAAAAHTPFIAAASPALFRMDSFLQLKEVRDLAGIFCSRQYIKWHNFRNSEDSRYVGLTLPHMLMRCPYGPDTEPVETFTFKEDVDGTDHRKYLWGNAAYAFATRLTDAFAKYHWCAAIRGVEGGGLVQGLPTHAFIADEGEVALKCPTEIAVTDWRESELINLGFIPLMYRKGTNQAVFFNTQSCQKAKKYATDEATANADLATQLQYTLTVSRFVHYLKILMMHDYAHHLKPQEDWEKILNLWIAQYVLHTPLDIATQEEKAKRPLLEAHIDYRVDAMRPDHYIADVWLRPHFQLDPPPGPLRSVVHLNL
jgi:type VI secretion system protein ImpC